MANEIEIIVKSTDRSGPGLDSAKGKTKSLSTEIDKLGKTAAAAFVLNKIKDWGVGFVQAAEESQAVGRQTEAVIESMGGASNVTAAHVSELTDRLSAKAGVDDELIQSGQNVLLTFGKVRNEVGAGNDIFDRATTSALDMSAALGQDLQGSAIMVGKALNDPVRGMTALTRAGVSFTQSQKDQVAAMVAAGDTIGAQKIILSELENQFGGAAEANATATGKMAVAWGNLQEEMGAKMLPTVGLLAGALTSLVQGPLGGIAVTAGMAGVGVGALGYLVASIVPNVKEAWEAFNELTSKMGRFGTVLKGLGIAGAIAGIAVALKAMDEANQAANIEANVKGFAELGAVWDDSTTFIMRLAEQMGHIQQQFDGVLSQAPELAEAWIEQAEAAGIDSGEIAIMRDKLEGYKDGAVTSRDAANRLNDELADSASEFATASEAAKEYSDTLKSQFDPLFGMIDAQEKSADSLATYREKQLLLNQAIDEHGRGSLEAMAAQAELDDAQYATAQSALGLQNAAATLMAGVEDGTISIDNARQALMLWESQGLLPAGAAADILAGRVAGATEQAMTLDAQRPNVDITETGAAPVTGGLMGAVRAALRLDQQHPDVPVTAVDHATGLLGAIQSRLNGLHDRTITITTREQRQFVNEYLRPIFRAHGGISGAASGGMRSGLTMVGERGRELVSLPAGSRVHPNNETEQMMAGAGAGPGGGINVYVQGSIRSDRDLVALIRDEMLRGGFRGLL